MTFWCSTSSGVDCRAPPADPEARSCLVGVARAASPAPACPHKENLATRAITRAALRMMDLPPQPEGDLLTKYGDNDFGDEFDNFP